jgi:translocation and assembly module TamA
VNIKKILILSLCAISTSAFASSPKLQLTISGIKGAALKNTTSRLAIIQKDIPRDAPQALIIHTLKTIPLDIDQAVKPYGYFNARVKMHYQKTSQGWRGDYQVTAGPKTRITNIDFRILGDGAHKKAFMRLIKNYTKNNGKPLNTVVYERVKNDLFNIASMHGFFMARMKTSQIRIDRTKHTAAIAIVFDTGKQYLFGQTHFSKNRLNAHFLKRYIHFKKGHAYNNNAVQTLRQNLIDSNYFHTVTVTPDLKGRSNIVPIDIKLTPKKSREYSLGAGFGTDTGPRALLGFRWKPVNQYGHSFNLEVRAAQKNNYYVANYIIPGHDPVTDQYAISAGYSTESVPTGTANSKSLGISYTSMWRGWQQILMLRYLNERYNINTLPNTRTNMLIPSVQWSYLKSNHSINPSDGYKIDITLSGAAKQALSRNSFFQVKASIKYLHTFGTTHTRFLTRAEIGHTVINHIENLPLSLQLLAGGAQSIRGYSYNSIGPGRNSFVGSVEIQQRIKGDFYIGAFYDAGTVSNKLFHNILQGVGPAFIWLSPVGMMELSLAHALSNRGANWAIQFSMGPTL